jgi:adenine-specific DNA glycosylase
VINALILIVDIERQYKYEVYLGDPSCRLAPIRSTCTCYRASNLEFYEGRTDNKFTPSRVLNVFHRETWSDFGKHHFSSGFVPFENSHFGNSHVNYLLSSQRKGALFKEFVLTPGGMFHSHNAFLCATHKVHSSAHSFDHLAGNNPVS